MISKDVGDHAVVAIHACPLRVGMKRRLCRTNICQFLVIAISTSALLAQVPVTAIPSETPARTLQQSIQDNEGSYVLGPDDRITITALHADEISGKPIPVDSTGSINLPMIGRLKVAGLTIPEVENAIASSLKTFIEKPLVTVN